MYQKLRMPKVNLAISQKYLAAIGIAAVAAILCSVAVLTAINLRQTSDRLDVLSRDTSLGDAYGRMLTSVAEASGHAQQFVATGDRQQASLTLQSIQAVLAADAEIKALGTDQDRALMTSLEARYGVQISQAQQLLLDPSLLGTLAITPDPLALTAIASDIAPVTLQKRQQAHAELISLQNGFASRSTAILAAFVISLPMLGLLIYLIVRYERQDAVQVLELKRMGQAALTDSVTGLGNHRAFQDDLRRELARASRAEQPLSVAMMDIDNFKVINDTYGHARGDQVLAELGKLMPYAIRGEDRSYRIGGDEFALIMPNTDTPSAVQALNRLRQTAIEVVEGLSISLGVSSNAAHERDAASLLEHADQALYQAKHRGKNQVVAYDSILGQGNEVTASKMTSILEVLKSAEVTMLFQPIFRPVSQTLLGFEALLRLPQEPELSGPEEAFDIAQHMGRSRDLDLLCAGHALDAARDLPNDLKIFINLDPATLMHVDFSPHDLLAMVAERSIDPAKVVFEITEKTTVPLLRLRRAISGIQKCGFAVALDDVGSGNSGLEMMRLMKFDYVKIDRSVILDAMNGGPGRAIILAIVAFARESGAFMIAEGIENQAMLESIKFDAAALNQFWVEGVQGFIFGKPRLSMTNLGTNVSGDTAAAA